MKDLTLTDALTRKYVTGHILTAKKKAGLSWSGIAEAMESLLGLPDETVVVLMESPTKIWEQSVPTEKERSCQDRDVRQISGFQFVAR